MTQIFETILNKKHFFTFNDSSALESSPNAVCIWSIFSSTDLQEMKASSKYTNANFHLTFYSTISIGRCFVLVAFSRPNGIRRNKYISSCNVNVYLSLSWSSIPICQYP